MIGIFLGCTEDGLDTFAEIADNKISDITCLPLATSDQTLALGCIYNIENKSDRTGCDDVDATLTKVISSTPTIIPLSFDDGFRLKKLLPNSKIIDVREADEFQSGHLPEAINLCEYDWFGKLFRLEKDQPCYCIATRSRAF